MHDRTMYTDSGDYTWTGIDPQDTLDGNGPQPEPTAYAYTIRGENITAVPCAPRPHIYDVATFPERLDADIAALREELTAQDRTRAWLEASFCADIAALREEIATMRAEIASAREDHRLWRGEMSGWTTIILDLATITNGIVDGIASLRAEYAKLRVTVDELENSALDTFYPTETRPCP